MHKEGNWIILSLSFVKFTPLYLGWERAWMYAYTRNTGLYAHRLCIDIWVWINTYYCNTIFRGIFTSINPSYFDVNYRGFQWFWHTAISPLLQIAPKRQAQNNQSQKVFAPQVFLHLRGSIQRATNQSFCCYFFFVAIYDVSDAIIH